ncbi:hypothetical protein OQH61_02275 [Helicobacter sp. MIT 21-1697]|uniref:hypothetical protein n=1 Tax=Helicobacter sp. MIT 21-1697 TaxID=2993733 RepID=UPI00224AD977|nr:hypothetical protein [Helicobacter sp. MIT 21-1697]MCX2716556.1 hypothetical protein [Helicobacter sp. MIT 21-1697]
MNNTHPLSAVYDEALGILQKSFNDCERIVDSKAQSQEQLFALIQANPMMESEIRMAILHFYNQCGLGAFVHYDKKQLQVITHIKNRTHNLYVQRICEFLKKHKFTLYKQEPSKEDFEELLDFVDTTLDLNAQSTKREMIKIALRNVFGIQARDALFFKDGNIKFFKFDYESVKINNEIRQINCNSHINVLSNEDRIVLDNALSMTNVQSLIVQNTLLILQKDIDLKRIDNLGFNKNFKFFAIQKLRIYIESLHIHHIDSLAKSIYCMYITQKYAWVMFEVVAKELLELCAKDNVNAIAFVEFYNGGSIELRGKILKKPLITDNNGNPWTIPLIKECLKNKKAVEFDIAQMQKRSDNFEEQIHTLNNQIQQNDIEEKDTLTKESSYQELLESKNKELRLLVDKRASKARIEAVTNEINTLILHKSHMLAHIENTQKNLAALGKEQIKLLEMQERLREQINYALKKNQTYFVQYDLLSRALADAIANAKELI